MASCYRAEEGVAGDAVYAQDFCAAVWHASCKDVKGMLLWDVTFTLSTVSTTARFGTASAKQNTGKETRNKPTAASRSSGPSTGSS